MNEFVSQTLEVVNSHMSVNAHLGGGGPSMALNTPGRVDMDTGGSFCGGNDMHTNGLTSIRMSSHQKALFHGNKTEVTFFILLGFPGNTQIQMLYFAIFLVIYILTLVANFLIIIIVCLNSHLHIPMYFFLSNFAVLDTWCSTAVIPKTLSYLITQDKLISHSGCLAQLCFVHSVGPTEFFLLTVMAYDRYLAICFPLQYATMMNSQICRYLAIGSWMSGFFTGWTLTIPTALLSFCGPNLIDHFFCDYIPLIKLSCSDTSISETVFFSFAWVVVLSSLIFTTVSYSSIIKTILRIPSRLGRQKAFSTCAAHLTVVIIFYGTVIFMYVRPRASYFSDKDKVVSLFYSVITPILNPLIYSLRNREFKKALKKVQEKLHKSINDV
ncbi:PREDICTED: olfactory receptor 6F1-like [Nanorana parkeri]|uniref:olfactory receptor 6F1-like n=1 Tax=Nanorana parkeri TaxID=125878 RepID=UPI000854841A|nr:PREDICTED: olfactory receptor 6F1-like [Nanorana parkeri]